MKRKFQVPLGRINEWKDKPDANLYLIQPGKGVSSDCTLIRFATRKALEAFNVKAKLKPLVFTDVPRNMAIHAHESDWKARQEIQASKL